MANTKEKRIPDVAEVNAREVKQVEFKMRLASETGILNSLVDSIVLYSQARVFRTTEHASDEITSDGSEALAKEITRSMLSIALKAGVDMAVFEGLLFEPGDTLQEDPVTLDEFARERLLGTEYTQELENAERTEA